MIESLKSLAYLNELELLKTILSSADRFPGLYRFDPKYGAILESDRYLKLIDFFEVIYLSEEKNAVWSRDAWLAAHEEIHNLSFGPRGRNQDRSEEDVKKLLESRYDQWVYDSKTLALCVLDTHQRVNEICVGETYYLMGSLIKFSEDCVLIGHDSFDDRASLKLNISFQETKSYIDKTFSSAAMQDLFWRARIIAHLEFKGEVSKLLYRQDQVDLALQSFNPGSPIVGAVVDCPDLPIRFAKFMGISRVNKFQGGAHD